MVKPTEWKCEKCGDTYDKKKIAAKCEGLPVPNQKYGRDTVVLFDPPLVFYGIEGKEPDVVVRKFKVSGSYISGMSGILTADAEHIRFYNGHNQRGEWVTVGQSTIETLGKIVDGKR